MEREGREKISIFSPLFLFGLSLHLLVFNVFSLGLQCRMGRNSEEEMRGREEEKGSKRGL